MARKRTHWEHGDACRGYPSEFGATTPSIRVLARMAFDQIPEPSVIHFNVMFRGDSVAGSQRETLKLFRLMFQSDARPSHYTFPFVIKSCDCSSIAREGDELHCIVTETGFVGPPLIDLYSSGEGIDLAREVFAEFFYKK